MIRKYGHDASVHVATTVEALEVGPDLHVFRRVRRSQVTAEGGEMSLRPSELTNVHDAEGFVDDANLASMLAGQEWEARRLRVMLPGGRRMFRELGFPLMDWDALDAFMPKKPFTAYVAGGLTPDDVVEMDISGYWLRRPDGRVLPTAIGFNYIDGGIRADAYDLPRLAEHLLARDDVVVHGRKGWRADEYDHRSRATSVEEAIHRIPHYNGGGQTLAFRWMPDEEAFAAVEAAARRAARGRAIHTGDLKRAVFDTDALGVRAAGAALFDDYYARTPEPTGDGEDEGFSP